MAINTTDVQNTTTILEEEEMIKSILPSDGSDTHDFTVWEDGTLDIMDNDSRFHGRDETPAEFVRLDIPSMRVLYALLSEPAVQAMLAEEAS